MNEDEKLRHNCSVNIEHRCYIYLRSSQNADGQNRDSLVGQLTNDKEDDGKENAKIEGEIIIW